MAHVRLFKSELIKCVTGENVHYFEVFFNNQKMFEEIAEDLKKGGKNKEMREKFWMNIAYNHDALEKLLSIALSTNPHIEKYIFKQMSKASFDYYAKFLKSTCERFSKMDAITATLEPVALCDQLNSSVYIKTVSEVMEMMEERLYDEASCYLMRSLPYYESDEQECLWYYDFVNACLENPANCTIPDFIDENYSTTLESYKEKQEGLKKPLNTHVKSKGIGFIKDEILEDQVCRSQEDYKEFRERVISSEQIHLLADPKQILLRPYQEELVVDACLGNNTIICAPTGSGKTIVAAYIILKHLEAMKAAEKLARVAVVVPTVPLVEQQTSLLNNYLRKIYWVDGMSGGENVDETYGRAPYVLASNVIVFTPQILINLLKSIREEDRLYFTDLTMLVFDECHHCDRDHPYHVLTRMLHDFNGPKPQIIGLTASLPVGGNRWNVEAAFDRMVQLCARLSTYSISTVRINKENLQQHVVPPIDEIRNARRPAYDQFANSLRHCMRKIEEALRPHLTKLDKYGLNLRQDETLFPSDQSSSRYGSYIGNLKLRVNEMKAAELKFQLSKLLEHLSYYYRALAITDLLPNWFVYKYVEAFVKKEEEHSRTESGVRDQLLDLFKKCVVANENSFNKNGEGEDKPLLNLLHEVVTKQLEDDPHSRIVVFVTTRCVCAMLSEHLNASKIEKCVASFLMSINKSSSEYGQGSDHQRYTIEAFNKGTINVLVATSVAEEGIDISACNLIVKYNSIGSHTTLIQRRGRARAKRSKSILLSLDDSIEEKELENFQKEYLMHRCLEYVQSLPEEHMKNLVEKKMNEEKVISDSMWLQDAEIKQFLCGRIYDVCCRLCGSFICKSNTMRVACEAHHVCCDPTIWKRLDTGAFNSSKPWGIATIIGKAHCLGTDKCDCREELGNVIKVYGAILPTISAKAIMLSDPNNPHSLIPTEKKWDQIKKNKFIIEQITEKDMKIMLSSLFDYSEEKLTSFENQAHLVVQRAITELRKPRKKEKVNIMDDEDDLHLYFGAK